MARKININRNGRSGTIAPSVKNIKIVPGEWQEFDSEIPYDSVTESDLSLSFCRARLEKIVPVIDGLGVRRYVWTWKTIKTDDWVSPLEPLIFTRTTGTEYGNPSASLTKLVVELLNSRPSTHLMEVLGLRVFLGRIYHITTRHFFHPVILPKKRVETIWDEPGQKGEEVRWGRYLDNVSLTSNDERLIERLTEEYELKIRPVEVPILYLDAADNDDEIQCDLSDHPSAGERKNITKMALF